MKKNKNSKNTGLGSGLSSLLGNEFEKKAIFSDSSVNDKFKMVPVEFIEPGPWQPRKTFDKSEIESLAKSIKKQGVIQPIILKSKENKKNEFFIIAGERRWRASQLAKIHEIPSIIRDDVEDEKIAELSLVENIQRSELNPIEEAIGYRQLMDKFGHTQEQMAEALGKSRPHIANVLRLLALPEDVQSLVVNGSLSSGHARALITAPNASDLARVVVARGLSVRQTEKLVKEPKTSGKERVSKSVKDADTRALEGDLSAALKMAVSITHNPGQEGGSITVRYKNLEQLD